MSTADFLLRLPFTLGPSVTYTFLTARYVTSKRKMALAVVTHVMHAEYTGKTAERLQSSLHIAFQPVQFNRFHFIRGNVRFYHGVINHQQGSRQNRRQQESLRQHIIHMPRTSVCIP